MTVRMTDYKPTLRLMAETAEDIMCRDPVSIRHTATIREALELLTERGISAAPVIDRAGRPIGVLSRTDLLIHQREAVPIYQKSIDWGDVPKGFHVEEVDSTLVEEVMTPAVFSVPPETPATAVIEHLLELKVHHLFVIDKNGVLTGVISTVDVLRHLKP